MKTFLMRVGKRLLLLAGALIFSLIVIEIILRMIGYSPAVSSPLTSFHKADPTLGWVGIPNLELRFKTLNFDVKVASNDEGFRKVTSNVVPDEDATAIWALGDSTTWGWGVDNGDLFTDHLQTLAGPEYRIRNYGVNAYGTFQQSILLAYLLEEKTPPSAVLLMVCSNDFTDNLTDKGGANPHLKRKEDWSGFEVTNVPVSHAINGEVAMIGRHSHAMSFLFYASSLYKQIRGRSKYEDVFAQSWDKVSETPKGEAPEPFNGERAGAMRFALDRMHSICEEHDIELIVMPFPEATTPYLKPASHLTLAQITAELGVKIIEISSSMAENRESYYIGNGDFHWNATGNRRGAEVFYEKAKESLDTLAE